MLTVAVNDRPIDVAAFVQNGRVFVPMRATFSALGAIVSYDPRRGVIVARSEKHELHMSLGSQDALVDGHSVHLDAAPRSIAARTYVPLRFVAQAMGAVVGYDARANVVNVISAPSRAGSGTYGAAVVALNPAPQSVVSTAYPTISASLGAATAANADVTLSIDGTDVTSQASFDGSTLTYMPRIGLTRGEHTAVFAGRTLAGEPFSASWSFTTTLEAAPDAPSFSSYAYRFYASGPSIYHAGDWMRFVLVAPPGGSAELELCGLGFQYGLWNSGSGSVYEANFPAPSGFWIPSCTVTATYTSWNGQQFFVPMPIVVGLYTRPHAAHPSPAPTFKPRPIPSEPRRAEQTPKPVPAATPRRVPPPHLIPLPHPVPRRTP